MATFILMTKLGADALKDADRREALGRAWLKKVKSACPDVRWISHYAIFGPYDFMDIYEADENESAQRVALISRAEGAVGVETWQALPYDDFLGLLDKLD